MWRGLILWFCLKETRQKNSITVLLIIGMSFYWYLSNNISERKAWTGLEAWPLQLQYGALQDQANWQLAFMYSFVYDVVNTWNSCIWTADCNNVCANDPPNCGCYLSNTTVTYKTFIVTKLNLSSSYTYCRLQNLANSVLTFLIWVKLKKIYYTWLSENFDLHITTCSSLGAPSICCGRFCANWAY